MPIFDFERVSNFSVTTLSSGLLPDSTVLNVSDISVFPPSGSRFRVVIWPSDQPNPVYSVSREIVIVERIQNTLNIIQRGAESTIAQSWSVGSKCACVITAGTIEQIVEKIGCVLISSQVPSQPVEGMLWINNQDRLVRFYTSATWYLIAVPLHQHAWNDVSKAGSRIYDIEDVPDYSGKPDTYLHVRDDGTLEWAPISQEPPPPPPPTGGNIYILGGRARNNSPIFGIEKFYVEEESIALIDFSLSELLDNPADMHANDYTAFAYQYWDDMQAILGFFMSSETTASYISDSGYRTNVIGTYTNLYGYIMGGMNVSYHPVGIIERLDFMNWPSTTVISEQLQVPRSWSYGLSGQNHGIIWGGRGYNFAQISSMERFINSTETSDYIGEYLDGLALQGGYTSSALTRGYYVWGWPEYYAVVYHSVDLVNYSISPESSQFGLYRHEPCCASTQGNGYIFGGVETITYTDFTLDSIYRHNFNTSAKILLSEQLIYPRNRGGCSFYPQIGLTS